MKVGLIGGGVIGRIHMEAYSRMDGVEVLLCEREAERRRACAEEFGLAATESMEEVLTSDVDFVDICLPTHLHEEACVQAAEAGKHVFCEKPLASSVPDAENIVEVCAEQGVKLGVGMVLRFFPEFELLRERYEEGVIGKAGVINAYRGGGGFPDGWRDWYADEQASGSVPVDLLIHDIDYIQSVFGRVESVFATRRSSLERENRYTVLSALMELKTGVVAMLDGAWYDEGRFHTRFEVAGESGVMVLEPEKAAPVRTTVRREGPEVDDVAVPESPLAKSPYQLELEDFIRALSEDGEPRVNPVEAVSALRVGLKMLESTRRGEKLQVEEE